MNAKLGGIARMKPLPMAPVLVAATDVVPTQVVRPSNVVLWPDCDVIAGDVVSWVTLINGTEVARSDYECTADPAEGKMLRSRANCGVVEIEIPPVAPEPVDPGSIVLPPLPEEPVIP